MRAAQHHPDGPGRHRTDRLRHTAPQSATKGDICCTWAAHTAALHDPSCRTSCTLRCWGWRTAQAAACGPASRRCCCCPRSLARRQGKQHHPLHHHKCWQMLARLCCLRRMCLHRCPPQMLPCGLPRLLHSCWGHKHQASLLAWAQQQLLVILQQGLVQQHAPPWGQDAQNSQQLPCLRLAAAWLQQLRHASGA